MRASLLSALMVALLPAVASANGRFPASQHVVVGVGSSASSIVVRTTFGLFVSRDGGSSFAWICEEAMRYGGGWDPSVELSADGAIVLGLPDGTLRSGDGCSFERPGGGQGDAVVDLASSRDGERVIAVTSGVGSPARVLVSGDRGRSFVARDPGVGDVGFTTVDYAPSRPERVWAIGSRGDPRRALLLRSDDGGMRFTVASESIREAPEAWLSGVDPRDPERVWVRVPREGETDLVRTDDGGRSWRVVFTLRDRMTGFALADDGMRVWVGGPSAGLWRSVNGGERFESVGTFPVLCLRHRGGALYACTDHARDGLSLVRLRDGMSALEPLLVYRDAEGTPDCPGSSPVFSTCAPLWMAQREALLRTVRDGGMDAASDVVSDVVRDVARDAAGDARGDAGGDAARDLTTMDVTAMDGGVTPGVVREGCSCSAASTQRGGGWAALGVALWVLCVRSRRGR